MRILITAALAATALMPVAASAQSGREVQQDRREVQQDRRQLQDARRSGDRDDRQDARRELREDRQETREDLQDYRRTHRDVYRQGAYGGPRGYSYRPVSVGYRFQPSYYARNYWVSDYGRYRLARPAYGTQWVRYGNDVVLVNLRSGRVLQVYNRFFF